MCRNENKVVIIEKNETNESNDPNELSFFLNKHKHLNTSIFDEKTLINYIEQYFVNINITLRENHEEFPINFVLQNNYNDVYYNYINYIRKVKFYDIYVKDNITLEQQTREYNSQVMFYDKFLKQNLTAELQIYEYNRQLKEYNRLIQFNS